jgi:hypothetical protein
VAGALDINGRAAGNTGGLSSKDGNSRALELSGTVGMTGALDINGRAGGNVVVLSSRDGNGRAPELSGMTDALDINGGLEGHGCHVRPAHPLGHSSHYTPAFGGDGYDRALELSGIVEVAGALDING